MVAARFILAIDQGTTSSRAVVFGPDQDVVSSAQIEIKQSYPQSGWVEHDPEQIWRTVCETTRLAIERAGLQPGDVAGIGLTNQRETIVVWDRATGDPIYPAIVWQDRRTAPICAALRSSGAEHWVKDKTGLLIDPYFSATKISWILDHIDGARQRAYEGQLAAGTIDCFLLWRLTGGRIHRTDATNASRTLLYDIQDNDWDDELCNLFRVPPSILPEVCDNASDFGTTEATLFGSALPIVGMAGDQQAAALGQACFDPGTIKATFGTGCFVMLNTGQHLVRSHHNLLSTIASRLDGQTTYALEGSVFIAGAAVQWLRDGLGIIDDAARSGDLAALADVSQSVVLVPAFAGLGAPYWEPNARGAIFGLNRNTGTRELAKATLESVCFQTSDLLSAMTADYGFALDDKGIRVDGGFVASDWAMQFQADILNCHVDRPVVTETTALGVAWLAGRFVGLWPTSAEYAASWRLERQFRPKMSEALRREREAEWRAAVEATLTYTNRRAGDAQTLSQVVREEESS